ncbi:hypothetical protein ACFODO_18175 [Acinetobacter sichuanensis]|uniref:Uncharacterized protein n=1 Tax=Acinetobacter sichuanensis TaxID=2136183 RepID=A0A371YJ73_9GAMM|nr:hypothetical protein [Acinetobacter sichuanensis]RFC81490.1 hypothetical protein C9E89_021560 [Acinetobacter sichuanensis]
MIKGALNVLNQQNKKHLDDFLIQNNIEPSSPRLIFEFAQDEEKLTELAQGDKEIKFEASFGRFFIG